VPLIIAVARRVSSPTELRKIAVTLALNCVRLIDAEVLRDGEILARQRFDDVRARARP
jgi:hypothetical protein